MGTVVLDASIVIALFDPQDALHAAASAAARRHRDAADDFLLPASVLAEVLVGAARQGEAELTSRRSAMIAAFGSPYAMDEEVAVAAARRRARHQSLRLPDALVLATADVTAADAVLAGDKRWRGLDPRIELVSQEADRRRGST
ncbi:MAG: PIN domain-containing protein [Streptosporangiaceae bacterium]